MGESEGTAGLQVRADFGLVDIGLFFIGDEDHRDIGFGNSFCHGFDFETCSAGHIDGFAALVQADDDIDTAFLQIQRMGMALAAVTDDGHLFTFHDIPVHVLIIKYLCHFEIPLS